VIVEALEEVRAEAGAGAARDRVAQTERLTRPSEPRHLLAAHGLPMPSRTHRHADMRYKIWENMPHSDERHAYAQWQSKEAGNA
jgi:uncharacterized membrane-anchored protein